MNLIAWIFYIIQKVMVVPVGSAKELDKTQSDANDWWKELDNPEHKLHNLKTKYFEFWGVKLFLLVASIWLIPYLRNVYAGKSDEQEMFTEGEEIGFKK